MGGQRMRREGEGEKSGDTDREREKKKKIEKNMNRATCSGWDFSVEKVCGLDFSQ